jgi:hypothetical protein
VLIVDPPHAGTRRRVRSSDPMALDNLVAVVIAGIRARRLQETMLQVINGQSCAEKRSPRSPRSGRPRPSPGPPHPCQLIRPPGRRPCPAVHRPAVRYPGRPLPGPPTPGRPLPGRPTPGRSTPYGLERWRSVVGRPRPITLPTGITRLAIVRRLGSRAALVLVLVLALVLVLVLGILDRPNGGRMTQILLPGRAGDPDRAFRVRRIIDNLMTPPTLVLKPVSAPRGAVCSDGGGRPLLLCRRSGGVKLEAAVAMDRW